MKKLIFMLLVIFGCVSASAQKDEKKTEANMIKLNLTSLPLKNFALQYERAVAKKITVAANVRFMPKGKLPFSKQIIKAVDDPETERQINNTRIGNFAVMPEVRFYVGKKGAFHGFYIAPYADIASYSTDIEFQYDDNGTPSYIPLSGKVSTLTGGVLFGAQWALGSKIYLDWWILGPNYGRSNGNISGKKTLSLSEQQDVRDALDGLDIPLTDYTYKVDGNGADIQFKGPWAGVRSAICIGFNF